MSANDHGFGVMLFVMLSVPRQTGANYCSHWLHTNQPIMIIWEFVVCDVLCAKTNRGTHSIVMQDVWCPWWSLSSWRRSSCLACLRVVWHVEVSVVYHVVSIMCLSYQHDQKHTRGFCELSWRWSLAIASDGHLQLLHSLVLPFLWGGGRQGKPPENKYLYSIDPPKSMMQKINIQNNKDLLARNNQEFERWFGYGAPRVKAHGSAMFCDLKAQGIPSMSPIWSVVFIPRNVAQ